jgi:membrane protein implicated in regulation of membrane protease activity
MAVTKEPFEPRPDWGGIFMRCCLAAVALSLIAAAAVLLTARRPGAALVALLGVGLVVLTWRRMPRLLSRRQREAIGRQRRAKLLDLERQFAKMRQDGP